VHFEVNIMITFVAVILRGSNIAGFFRQCVSSSSYASDRLLVDVPSSSSVENAQGLADFAIIGRAPCFSGEKFISSLEER
jgi:hypothetical protein